MKSIHIKGENQSISGCFIAAMACLLLLCGSRLQAQPAALPPPKVKIAVLCPLYLDSAFSDYTYTLGNKNMPQYILTGLEFYNGVMMAVDSLKKENVNAEVWIYDTKKKNANIDEILRGMKFLNFSLIIASFNSAAEQKEVSQFSFANNVPVVSVTYPNDAGISANPYFVILNSTLKTHVNGVYNYVNGNFLSNKPIFVTKDGSLESRIATYFKANDATVRNHFAYKVVHLNNDVFFDNLKPYLDSNRQNVIVCGSMDADFATSLVNALGSEPSYRVTVVGMPNWDGVRKLYNTGFDNVDIVYSTPFNFSLTDSSVQTVTSEYRDKFYARPSDLVYKGFEAMYHFTHLIVDYHNEFPGHLSDSTYRWQNEFSIQPVTETPQALVPDYQENKNLYFIKKNKNDVVSVKQVRP